MDDSKSVKAEQPLGQPSAVATASDADTELSEANAFLDAIVEDIPHMIFVKDAEHLAFKRFNRAVQQAVTERGFLFLQKPFAPHELVNMVRTLAAAAESSAASSIQARPDDPEPE